jgi:hypothetical protein
LTAFERILHIYRTFRTRFWSRLLDKRHFRLWGGPLRSSIVLNNALSDTIDERTDSRAPALSHPTTHLTTRNPFEPEFNLVTTRKPGSKAGGGPTKHQVLGALRPTVGNTVGLNSRFSGSYHIKLDAFLLFVPGSGHITPGHPRKTDRVHGYLTHKNTPTPLGPL